MSIAILVQGKIERAPESRTSRNGAPFMMATLRVSAGNELQFWRIFAFSESAQAELTRLDAGDALAVQGTPKFEIWRPEGGGPRVSLSLTADHVLALKQPPRARAPKAEKPAAPPASTSPPTTVPGTRTRAERVAGDGADYFHDDVGF